MESKRGQISIYLVVGIVLILIFSVLFFLITTFRDDTRNFAITENIDENFAAIRTYTEQCLQNHAEDALLRIGNQGGYVDPIYEVNEADLTQSEGIPIFPGSEQNVPYWIYMDSENTCLNNCRFGSFRPALTKEDGVNSIEEQIEKYLDDKVQSCIDNFRPLREQGYNIRIKELPRYEVNIQDFDVQVFMTYPLEASKDGVVQDISQFLVTIDVPLKRMHEFATLISLIANEVQFVEHHSMELISQYSGVEKEIPPIAASRFEYVSSSFWVSYIVEQRVQELLTVYLPVLQVNGTKNYEPIVVPKDQYSGPYADITRTAVQRMYDRMTLPYDEVYLDEDHPGFRDLDVDFNYYPEYDMYFKINGGVQVVQPHSMSSDYIPTFGIQQYQNYYDLSFPTKVTITSEEALQNRSYQFVFALESNIRDNQPFTAESETLPGFTSRSQGDLFCNEDQKNSGDISFNLLDRVTEQPVEQASVHFSCGNGINEYADIIGRPVTPDELNNFFTNLQNQILNSRFDIQIIARNKEGEDIVSLAEKTADTFQISQGGVILFLDETWKAYTQGGEIKEFDLSNANQDATLINIYDNDVLFGVAYQIPNGGSVAAKVEKYKVMSDPDPILMQEQFTPGGSSCPVGSIKDGSDFNNKFPICVGGIMTISAPEYEKKWVQVNTFLDEDNDLGNIYLQPIQEITTQVFKKDYRKLGGVWQFDNTKLDLGLNELAIISMSRVKQTQYDQEFATVAIVNGSQRELSTLRILPGNYTVDIQIINFNEIVIPKERRTAGGTFKKKKYTIPEVVMPSMVSGQYVKDIASGLLEVTQEDINKGHVTFIAMGFDLEGACSSNGVRCRVEDLDKLEDLPELLYQYNDEFQPQFEVIS